MTRFVVDARAVVHLATDHVEIAAAHRLLAPVLLRSEALSLVHEAVQRGELAADAGLERLRVIGRTKIRYLGDAVLRRRAWDLAERLRLGPTSRTEYLALTQLQADALVALDPELARLADGVVPLATIDDLR
jgi:predicted nucleic acid-binding protein